MYSVWLKLLVKSSVEKHHTKYGIKCEWIMEVDNLCKTDEMIHYSVNLDA